MLYSPGEHCNWHIAPSGGKAQLEEKFNWRCLVTKSVSEKNMLLKKNLFISAGEIMWVDQPKTYTRRPPFDWCHIMSSPPLTCIQEINLLRHFLFLGCFLCCNSVISFSQQGTWWKRDLFTIFTWTPDKIENLAPPNQTLPNICEIFNYTKFWLLLVENIARIANAVQCHN